MCTAEPDILNHAIGVPPEYIPTCRICGSTSARWAGRLGSRLHWQCRQCGFEFSAVLGGPETLEPDED